MTDPNSAFEVLSNELRILQAKYLSVALTSIREKPSDKLPDNELLDVRAFTVLAHAVFEGFFESLAQWTLSEIERGWISTPPVVHIGIATLALHCGTVITVTDDTKTTRYYDRIREMLTAAKSLHSKTIKDNHGISTKYLRKLFYPLSVNLPADTSKLNSLDSFADLRGEIAHKSSFSAQKEIDPVKIENYTKDCVEIAKHLRDQIIGNISLPAQQGELQ